MVFGDFRVPISTNSDGIRLVLLKDISVGAGLKVTNNRDLGTVDVYSTTAGTQGAEDWNDQSPEGGATTGSGSEYSINVPPQLELLDDPSVMATIASKLGEIPNGKLRGLVIQRNGSGEAALMLLTVGGMPPVDTVTHEMQIAAAQVRLGGKDFVKLQYLKMEGGKPTVLESRWYVHFRGGEDFV